jgi:hypothetical protein
MTRVSKKSKPRRGTPGPKAPATGRTAGQAASGRGRSRADEIVENVLSSLWAGIASGDLLRAEVESGTCMGIPRVLGESDPGYAEKFVATVLVDGAVRRGTPDGAALLRLLMALGTPDTRRAASKGLAELTSAGIYPPEWVTQIGKAIPGQAWRRYDLFGDDEAVAVTFSYGEAEHGIVARIDLAGIPVAASVGVSSDAERLVKAITGEDEEFERSEQISLAEARRRLLGPLDRCDSEPDPKLSADTLAYLPIARSRVRRLPAAEAEPTRLFTAADRAAAVGEFMKSPEAAGAVAADEESARFWAEVLTGYTGRTPGVPPTQVGPRTLAHLLLGHVPNTFVLSAPQRSLLEPAVTAWVRWSAGQRELGEDGTAVLMERVPHILSRFGEAYDDQDAVAIRGYASGLAASDADVAWLSDNVGRRMFALPLPQRHAPLDLADPADRRDLVTAEFGECTPPSGLTREEFVEAAYRVVEDIWRDGENPTYQAARRMFAEGVSRHDLIHQLAGAPRLGRRRPACPGPIMAGQGGAQPGQRGGVGMFGRMAVADHQARPAVVGRRAVLREPLDRHAMLAGPGDDGVFGVRSGKFEDRLQARGYPGDLQPLIAQGGGQPVPAAPVDQPGPADLPVVAARGDELGQGQLVERGRPGSEFRQDRVQQPRRDDQPAEPQAGGQALAGRAGVDDAIGGERLQRAHRLPVVPELPVVVVLDHHAAPVGRLPAASRVQRHAQRELVRRSQQHGVRLRGRRADDGTHAVDRQRPQPQALRRGDAPVGAVAVGLHREGPRARRA